jgi:hypothetical protein
MQGEGIYCAMKTCKDFGDELCAGCADPMVDRYPAGSMCHIEVYGRIIRTHRNCCSSSMVKSWILHEATGVNFSTGGNGNMRCLRRALVLYRSQEVATLDKIVVLLP